MENPDLRLAMGMKPDQKGVRIRRVDPTAPESNVLKPSDIILSFDGVDIANDGTGNSHNIVVFSGHFGSFSFSDVFMLLVILFFVSLVLCLYISLSNFIVSFPFFFSLLSSLSFFLFFSPICVFNILCLWFL